MAKRKGPKLVDLKANHGKITAEDLQRLQQVVKAISGTQNEIGVAETRKHNLLHSVVELQQALSALQIKFKEDYGTDNINIADGTILGSDE